jgi:hypothetical protein
MNSNPRGKAPTMSTNETNETTAPADGRDELPSLAEFSAVRRTRCRLKFGFAKEKSLAAEVVEAFGDAARTVLARRGLTVDAAGTVRCEEEAEIDAEWKDLVARMYAKHGEAMCVPGRLPCDTTYRRDTGVVELAPIVRCAIETAEGGDD